MTKSKQNLIVVAALVAAGAVGVFTWLSFTADARLPSTELIYLTVDDGKTYFAADAGDPPPVMVNGKPAVQAIVFRCPNEEAPFVGYLLRYTERGKSIAGKNKTAEAQRSSIPSMALMSEIQVKRPTEQNWVRQSDIGAASTIMAVRCKSDPSKPAEMVTPTTGEKRVAN